MRGARRVIDIRGPPSPLGRGSGASAAGGSDPVRHQVRPRCRASSGAGQESPGCCRSRAVTIFSTKCFKGAPPARHAYGRNRQRELARATGGEQSGRGTGDKRQGSPGVSQLRGGSFRRALRAEALRRDELPRTAAPAPAAAGPRRHAPMPRHTSRARPSRSRRVRRSPCERSQPPGRNAAGYPGRPLQRQGHPHPLRDARPLSAGASADPAGLTARARPKARPQIRAANLPAAPIGRTGQSEVS